MFHAQLNGQDLHAPTNTQVENDTGTTVPVLTAVTYNGIGTNFPSVVLANGATDRVRGVTQTAIVATAGSNTGFITSLGFLIGTAASPANTSAWTEGTALYAGAAGALQTTPNGAVVATVYKQDSQYGVLYVENSYASGGGGSGNVVGPSSSTNQAIATWNGTTGTVLQDNPSALVQSSGAVQAQAIVYNRQILEDVTVPDGYTMVGNDIELDGGDITLFGSAELILV
jgi:hypothetical protein